MRILITNKYFYLKGGADQSMFRNAGLLRSKGHELAFFSMHHPLNKPTEYQKYFVSNVDYHARHTLFERMKIVRNIIYNKEANRKFEELIKDFRPDVIQSHSIYHQLSPSIYAVAKKHKVPVVQFLHDYKVVCPAYLLFTKDRICPDRCKGKRFFWCTLKRCNDNSITKSMLSSLEMYVHRALCNYYGMVDLFISPSRFMTQKVLSMGLQPKEILTLPYFIETHDITPSYTWKNREIIYFGRLSREKGIKTLISAVKGLDVKLTVIGSGPLQEDLSRYVSDNRMQNVSFIPYMERSELLVRLQDCMFTVVPSEWNENYPNTVMESFACGKPVIGADIGGIPEMVMNDRTGLTFEPGNGDDLREKILLFLSNPERITAMGRKARKFIQTEFTEDDYYRKFIEKVMFLKKN
jgi:glycosyltransferase involved in cell wall biosynthesis